VNPTRAFAHATGLPIADRGRIPGRVNDAHRRWLDEYAEIRLAGSSQYLRDRDCEPHLHKNAPLVITRRPMPFSPNSWDVRTETGYLLGHLPGPNPGKAGVANALAVSINPGYDLTAVITDTGSARKVNGRWEYNPNGLCVPTGIRLQHAVFTRLDNGRTLGLIDPTSGAAAPVTDEVLPPRANIATGHGALSNRINALLNTDDITYLCSWGAFGLTLTWQAQSAGTGPWQVYDRTARRPSITKDGRLAFQSPAINCLIAITGVTRAQH
jgi:hypothetical protein